MLFAIVLLTFLLNAPALSSQNDLPFITQTVYGFLDFTTTIGNTVMVFSPQSTSNLENNTNVGIDIIDTTPILQSKNVTKNVIKPTKLSNLIENPSDHLTSIAKNSISQSSSENNNVTLSNVFATSTVSDPEYDLLSRQPTEFVDETFRLINLKANSINERRGQIPSKSNSFGIISENHSNKVLATFSKNEFLASHEGAEKKISSFTRLEKKEKRRPMTTMRHLKTITPPLESSQSIFSASSRRPNLSKHHHHKSESVVVHGVPESNISSTTSRKSSRHKGKRRNKTSKILNTISPSSQVNVSPRRIYRTKTLSSTPEKSTSSQYAPKLNRRPGRWQYKTSPKPKINIRKHPSNTTSTQDILLAETSSILENRPTQNLIWNEKDLNASGSQPMLNTLSEDEPLKNLVQTINVDISTPDNFVDTYFEIATIKSPIIFQAGVLKKTRFITMTSTIEKFLKNEPTEIYSEVDGPLSENILEIPNKENQIILDGSISTLTPIHIKDTVLETPKLRSVTESYKKSSTKIKTQLLPLIYDKFNETIILTLLQTYDFTSLITVTRTVSPLDESDVISPQDFKDIEAVLDEAGSEINLNLEFGDDNNMEKTDQSLFRNNSLNNEQDIKFGQEPENKNSNHVKNMPLLNVLTSSTDLSTIFSTSSPILKIETIWESHVVPLIKGSQTILRTLSKSIGTIEKTDYITETSTFFYPTTQNSFPLNQFFNPLFSLPQPSQIITSSEVQQTKITQTNSKVLKLTFGAKTAYTTIFSTEVLPTILTKFVTSTLQFLPSTPYPNFFSLPYPPFGYVG